MEGTSGSRDLDVVVLGATGVTGRRVCSYLAERAPEVGATWAAAGRDAGRVRDTLDSEGVTDHPEVIEADVGDRPSLAHLADRADVVLNLVGPYTRYAEPVIAACISGGAHYFDLSGEIPFVGRMVRAYHDQARAKGVRVVQVSGFESLPVDLGSLLAAETARQRYGEPLAEIDAIVTMRQPPGRPRASDTISGGTFGSMSEAVADPDARAVLDPAVLLPPGADADAVRRNSPMRFGARRGADGAVVIPMAPAPFINPPVIHRTNALLAAEGEGLGPRLRYREGMALKGGRASLPLRAAGGAMMGMTMGSFGLLARAPAPVRRAVSRGMLAVGPKAGYGPAADRIADWSWRFEITAKTEGEQTVVVTVDGAGHPGYLTTATMLGEAGLILADPTSNLPNAAGSLTPATALGTAHLDRFEAGGLRFSVSA